MKKGNVFLEGNSFLEANVFLERNIHLKPGNVFLKKTVFFGGERISQGEHNLVVT